MIKEFRNNLKSIEGFSDYLFLHDDVNTILKSQITNEKKLFYNKREVDDDVENYLATRVGFSILSLSILGLENQEYLYGYDVTTTNFRKNKSKIWAETNMILSDEIMWIGLYNRDDIYGRDNDYVISLRRFIYDPSQDRKIGLMILELSPRDILQEWDWLENENFSVFLLDGNDRILYPSETYIGLGRKDMEEEWNNDGFIVSEEEITPYGWNIVIVQSTEYRRQLYSKMLIITVIVFIIVMLLYIIMFFFTINRITLPLRSLTQTIHKIQEGDHKARYHYTADDEVGYLTSNFNTMLDRIDSMREESLLNERKKNDAEIRALQAQMNPHFLYNTLNSIKWMAIIQGADNIVNSLEILSRLLRAGMNKKGPLLPLKEELNMLDDYVTLQKIRYKSKFSYHCTVPESLNDRTILKYMIQPVVENAVFHGIEPKEGTGKIEVTVEELKDNLIITVEDNGVGFDSQKFNPLSDYNPDHKGNRIGLNNIQERIVREFGREYGLTYDSRPNEYTRITLTIPSIPYSEKENQLES